MRDRRHPEGGGGACVWEAPVLFAPVCTLHGCGCSLSMRGALLIWGCVYIRLNQTREKKFWVGSHPAWFQMFFLLLQSEHKLGLFIYWAI